MRRGEVWWARLPPPAGRRPVLLLSRDKAIEVRQSVTAVQVTRTVRDIPTEVRLGREDGMPKACVANADVIFTIPKALLLNRVCRLAADRMDEVAEAVKFALDLA